VSETSSTDDGTPVCLHCEINELVRERVEQAGADLADLALMIVESLAELILLAPNGEQSKLMADVLAHFGHTFLERSGVTEEGALSSRH
jgi:hypothetical protein